MAQKFYIDANGNQFSLDGREPDPSWIEVPEPRPEPGMTWNGQAWAFPKAALKALAADKRFRVETGGLVVGGIPIATDRQAQAMITGAGNLFDKDPSLLTVDWSIDAENFVTLDKATVQQNGILIGRHVQASFTAQRQIVALIDAGDITTAEQIEAWAGWPSNS